MSKHIVEGFFLYTGSVFSVVFMCIVSRDILDIHVVIFQAKMGYYLIKRVDDG